MDHCLKTVRSHLKDLCGQFKSKEYNCAYDEEFLSVKFGTSKLHNFRLDRSTSDQYIAANFSTITSNVLEEKIPDKDDCSFGEDIKKKKETNFAGSAAEPLTGGTTATAKLSSHHHHSHNNNNNSKATANEVFHSSQQTATAPTTGPVVVVSANVLPAQNSSPSPLLPPTTSPQPPTPAPLTSTVLLTAAATTAETVTETNDVATVAASDNIFGLAAAPPTIEKNNNTASCIIGSSPDELPLSDTTQSLGTIISQTTPACEEGNASGSAFDVQVMLLHFGQPTIRLHTLFFCYRRTRSSSKRITYTTTVATTILF